ncbi:MAG: Mammalian cell entry related domain protein [Solirubrobacterales bacterium]|nr:Mammalian cell entry related domain protein [Solirubrobacterales bacterium]
MTSRLRTLADERPALLGLIAIAVTVFALLMAVTRGGLLLPGAHVQLVTAQFASTNELREGNSVRVAGIKVGTVRSITLDPSAQQTTVKLALTKKDLHVRSDATAQLRWTTLLGGRLYVDLHTGSPSMPASTGDIPLRQTRTQVEFDQLTDTLQGNGRQQLKTTIGQMRAGLADPKASARVLRELAPAMTSIKLGLPPLRGEQPDDLRGLVDSTAKTLQGLGDDTTALQGLVVGAAQTTQVTAEERSALGAALRIMPATLQTTRGVTRRIDHTLTLLDPLSDSLRPGARALAPSATNLKPFLERAGTVLLRARPLLRDLSPSVRALSATAKQGRPLLNDVTPVLNRLDGELLPFLEKVDPDTDHRTIDMIGPTLAGVANASSQFDDAGNILHFGVLGDERTGLSLPCQTFVTDPTATEKVRCDALQSVISSIFKPVAKRGK